MKHLDKQTLEEMRRTVQSVSAKLSRDISAIEALALFAKKNGLEFNKKEFSKAVNPLRQRQRTLRNIISLIVDTKRCVDTQHNY